MGGYTRTGRAQRRGRKDEEGRVTGYYLVNVSPGDKIFTMKVNDEFYEQLRQLVEEWEGTWSYAAVVRQLVAEATGHVVMEELKVPTQVALKARMPAKTVEQEVKMTKPKKQEVEPGKTVLEQLGEEFPPEVVERLAKVEEVRQKMCLGKTEEQVEVALKAWGV